MAVKKFHNIGPRLHVDACWGGAAILSNKLKGLMSGSERVDSLAWNAHKMLGSLFRFTK